MRSVRKKSVSSGNWWIVYPSFRGRVSRSSWVRTNVDLHTTTFLVVYLCNFFGRKPKPVVWHWSKLKLKQWDYETSIDLLTDSVLKLELKWETRTEVNKQHENWDYISQENENHTVIGTVLILKIEVGFIISVKKSNLLFPKNARGIFNSLSHIF